MDSTILEHIVSLLPTFSCAFWTILLVIDRVEYGDRGMHSRLLWWMATTTLLYACHAVYFIHYQPIMVVTDVVYVYCNLAVYPLYARYLLHLTRGGTSRRTDALIFAPPIVMAAAVAILYGMMDAEGRQTFVDTYLYNNITGSLHGLELAQAVVHSVCKVMFAVGVVATLVTGVRVVKKYNQLVDSTFADVEDKHLWGLSRMLYCVAVVCVISLIANGLGKSMFSHSYTLLAIPSLLFTIVLFALAYIGYKNTFSYNELQHMLPAEDDIDEQEPQPADTLTVRLEQVIKDEHLYLNPNLKVQDLATRLCTNARYVQHAFNDELKMSFAEYINRLRLEHAQELLRQYPDMKIQDVCTGSGFGSVSTYYRNLRRYPRA